MIRIAHQKMNRWIFVGLFASVMSGQSAIKPVVQLAETQIPIQCGQDRKIKFDHANLRAEMRVSAVKDNSDALEYRLSLAGDEAGCLNDKIFLGVKFHNWKHENFVLAPAAVYNSNNFHYSKRRYPPLWNHPKHFDLDMPTTIAKLKTPRLTPASHPHPSHEMYLKAGDTAATLIGVWEPQTKRGTILLADQAIADGTLIDFHVKVDSTNQTAFVLAGVPNTQAKQMDLRIRVFEFDAPSVQSLYQRVFQVRKQISVNEPTSVVPFSAAFQMVHDLYLNSRWSDELQLFRISDRPEGAMNKIWQLGWVGGGMFSLPLLMQGSDTMQELCKKNLEMIYTKSQGPSGFFYSMRDRDGNFFHEGFSRPHPHNMLMVRKQGDWLYWSLKHFQWFEQRGETVPAHWKAGTRKLADAFVKLWKTYGQFGMFINFETSEMQIGNSCAGAVIPAALALASSYYDNPEYLEIAERAATKYDRDYVKKGITTGGPGEILSAPDSESAFAMLESFLVLYESTGKAIWLDASSRMAAQCATWVHANDFPFPKRSALGNVNARSTGAVWASVVNRHGAPAICTLSGDSLFRLWRASGDPLILELAQDIAHGVTQYLCTPGRQIGRMPVGGICERVNTSQWEGRRGVGGKIFGSCSWTETALLATCTDFPGLYVQPDIGFFHVFDHITATKVSHKAGKLVLRLKNPTAFSSTVSVFSESSTQVKKCLPRPLVMSRTISLAPGEEKTEIFE